LSGLKVGGKSPQFIQLEGIKVHGDTMLLRVSYHERLDPILVSGLFYAKYDFALDEVPLSILSVPLLGFLAPLCWLTGAELRFGDVDATYLESLAHVAAEFKRMYPWLSSSGKIVANPVKTDHTYDPEKYCVLYSAGVDSTCSLIRKIDKLPSTLTVRGTPDLPLQDQAYWNRVQERSRGFLNGLGVEPHIVETNALSMVNQQAIRVHSDDRLKVGWWEELAFGLFYLSICAPYSFHGKIGSVVIGSSNTARDQIPWGSTPMTDEKVRWGDVRAIHDSYELSRAEKIRQVILPYARRSGTKVPLRVCIGRRSAISATDQLNCGECAKCMVVEFILILSGVDAADFGFNISPAALLRLRRNLEEGRFGRSYDESSWSFIKEEAKSPPAEIIAKHPGLREFLKWFAAWNERPVSRRRLLDRMAPPGSRRRDLARAGFGKRKSPADRQSR
jgi:hypothetical protein